MCFNVAASYGGWAILATDQRHSCYLNGVAQRFDHGGKLCRLGRGLVSITGKTSYYALALEHLVSSQVDAADIDAVARCLSESADSIAAAVPECWPLSDTTPPDEGDKQGGVLVATPGNEVAMVAWNGKTRRRGRDTVIMSFPDGFPKSEWHTHADAFMAALCKVQTFGAIVRLIAADFAYMAQRNDAMSPTVEIAWRDRYLTGRASELAVATDDDIRAALTTPPEPCIETLSLTLTEYAA